MTWLAVRLEYSRSRASWTSTVNDTYLGTYHLSEKTEVETLRTRRAADRRGCAVELDNDSRDGGGRLLLRRDSKQVGLRPQRRDDRRRRLRHGAGAPEGVLDVQVQTSTSSRRRRRRRPGPGTQFLRDDRRRLLHQALTSSSKPARTQTSTGRARPRQGRPGDVLHAGHRWDFDLAMGQFRVPEKAADRRAGVGAGFDILGNKRGKLVRAVRRATNGIVQRATMSTPPSCRATSKRCPANIDALEGHLSQFRCAKNFEVWDVLQGEASTWDRRGHVISDTDEGEVAYCATGRPAGRSSGSAPTTRRCRSPIRVRRSTIGWERAVTSGMVAGTTEQALRLEAVRRP